jgi:hypothetical protein
VLGAPRDEATIARVREQVRALCRRFPVYPEAVRSGLPVEEAA